MTNSVIILSNDESCSSHYYITLTAHPVVQLLQCYRAAELVLAEIECRKSRYHQQHRQWYVIGIRVQAVDLHTYPTKDLRNLLHPVLEPCCVPSVPRPLRPVHVYKDSGSSP